MAALIVFCLILIVIVIFVAGPGRRQKQQTPAPMMSREATASMGATLLDGLSLEWSILYEDRNGDAALRDITVQAFVGRKVPYYAKAFCHLRQEERHFQFDRMIRVTDKRTGREIRDPAAYARSYWDEARGYISTGSTYQQYLAPRPVTIANALEPSRMIGIRCEGFDWTVDVSEHGLHYDRPYVRGRAKRPRSENLRAWTGTRSLYLDQPHTLFDPNTGEEIPSLEDWLRADKQAPENVTAYPPPSAPST